MAQLRLFAVGRGGSDEELMEQLLAGHQDALATLYSRYAPLIFSLSAQSLDRGAAEDIVQDVFFTVWKRADTFDAERGAFKPWVLQIAHHRIVNELRRRSRRPRMGSHDELDLGQGPRLQQREGELGRPGPELHVPRQVADGRPGSG